MSDVISIRERNLRWVIIGESAIIGLLLIFSSDYLSVLPSWFKLLVGFSIVGFVYLKATRTKDLNVWKIAKKIQTLYITINKGKFLVDNFSVHRLTQEEMLFYFPVMGFVVGYDISLDGITRLEYITPDKFANKYERDKIISNLLKDQLANEKKSEILKQHGLEIEK